MSMCYGPTVRAHRCEGSLNSSIGSHAALPDSLHSSAGFQFTPNGIFSLEKTLQEDSKEQHVEGVGGEMSGSIPKEMNQTQDDCKNSYRRQARVALLRLMHRYRSSCDSDREQKMGLPCSKKDLEGTVCDGNCSVNSTGHAFASGDDTMRVKSADSPLWTVACASVANAAFEVASSCSNAFAAAAAAAEVEFATAKTKAFGKRTARLNAKLANGEGRGGNSANAKKEVRSGVCVQAASGALVVGTGAETDGAETETETETEAFNGGHHLENNDGEGGASRTAVDVGEAHGSDGHTACNITERRKFIFSAVMAAVGEVADRYLCCKEGKKGLKKRDSERENEEVSGRDNDVDGDVEVKGKALHRGRKKRRQRQYQRAPREAQYNIMSRVWVRTKFRVGPSRSSEGDAQMGGVLEGEGKRGLGTEGEIEVAGGGGCEEGTGKSSGREGAFEVSSLQHRHKTGIKEGDVKPHRGLISAHAALSVREKLLQMHSHLRSLKFPDEPSYAKCRDLMLRARVEADAAAECTGVAAESALQAVMAMAHAAGLECVDVCSRKEVGAPAQPRCVEEEIRTRCAARLREKSKLVLQGKSQSMSLLKAKLILKASKASPSSSPAQVPSHSPWIHSAEVLAWIIFVETLDRCGPFEDSANEPNLRWQLMYTIPPSNASALTSHRASPLKGEAKRRFSGPNSQPGSLSRSHALNVPSSSPPSYPHPQSPALSHPQPLVDSGSQLSRPRIVAFQNAGTPTSYSRKMSFGSVGSDYVLPCTPRNELLDRVSTNTSTGHGSCVSTGLRSGVSIDGTSSSATLNADDADCLPNDVQSCSPLPSEVGSKSAKSNAPSARMVAGDTPRCVLSLLPLIEELSKTERELGLSTGEKNKESLPSFQDSIAGAITGMDVDDEERILAKHFLALASRVLHLFDSMPSEFAKDKDAGGGEDRNENQGDRARGVALRVLQYLMELLKKYDGFLMVEDCNLVDSCFELAPQVETAWKRLRRATKNPAGSGS